MSRSSLHKSASHRRARPWAPPQAQVCVAPHRRKRLALMLAAVVAPVIAVFARVVGQDFVLWDDTIQVYKNPYLNPVTAAHVAYFWQHIYKSLYIPVAYTAFAGLALMARLPSPDSALTDTGAMLNPHVFHTASLAVHVINVALVFAILRRLVGADLPAVGGALLFGVHPLQVESVAWVSELRGLLCGCFSLVSIWLYVGFARAARDGRSDGRQRLRYGGAVLAGVVALLSKPSAVSLPLILFALDRWCIGRPTRRCVASVAAWLAVSVPFVVLTRSAQPVRAELITAWWTRPLVAGDALAFYLAKLVAPVSLAIDYGRTPTWVVGHAWAWVTWLIPLGVGGFIWTRRKSEPWLVAAGVVSVASLLPVLGLVPFSFQYYSTVADRYCYVALLGPALVVAFVLRTAPSQLTLAACAAALLGLCVVSVGQVRRWDNSETLLTHALAINQNSDVSHSNLGIALARRGQLDDAADRFHAAIRLNGGNYMAHSNLGNVLLLKGQRDEAIAEYRTSIGINPDWPEAHNNLGNALALGGNFPAAIDQFQEALRLDPDYESARAGLQKASVAARPKPAAELSH